MMCAPAVHRNGVRWYFLKEDRLWHYISSFIAGGDFRRYYVFEFGIIRHEGCCGHLLRAHLPIDTGCMVHLGKGPAASSELPHKVAHRAGNKSLLPLPSSSVFFTSSILAEPVDSASAPTPCSLQSQFILTVALSHEPWHLCSHAFVATTACHQLLCLIILTGGF